MRLLIFCQSLGRGGAERAAIYAAGGLAARGHEPLIAHGASAELAPLAQRMGIATESISPTPLASAPLIEWVRLFRPVARRFQPRIIHAQSVRTALAARLAAPMTPLLVTVHGIRASDEARAAALVRVGNRVAAVSEASADGMLRFWYAPQIDVLSNCIDIERAEEMAAEPVAQPRFGEPAFLCVARLYPEKGVDVLVAAFAGVRAALPTAGLTVIGYGPELGVCQELAERLGLSQQIRFLGDVANALPYIAAADVVALPSRREGLPLVVLETLGLARPLVATAVGGTPQVVRDGDTGWLVAPEDPDALASAMVAAGRDPVDAARRGAAGQDLVARRYAAADVYDRLDLLLRQTAGDAARLRIQPAPYYAAKHAVQAMSRRRRSGVGWRGLRILCYHRVSPDRDELSITPARFREHMEALASSGLPVVSIATALDQLDAGDDTPRVVVTFDDGFRDVGEHAVPVLREHGIPAVVFVTSRVADGVSRFEWYRRQPPVMGWVELAALAANGLVALGSHTRTHAALPGLSDQHARREIFDSRTEIAEQAHCLVDAFCYPAGRFTDRDVALVTQAGYRCAVTCEPGVNATTTPRILLRRTLIDRRDTLADFRAKLDGRFDTPLPIRAWLHARRVHAGTRGRDSVAPRQYTGT